MLKIFHLNKAFAKVKAQASKLSVAGDYQLALDNAQESFDQFNICTKGVWPRIKSIILFTKEFKLRTMCARQLQALQASVDAAILQDKEKPPLRHSMTLARSKSDTEVYLRRNNYSRPTEGEARVRASDDINVRSVFGRRLGQ